VNTGGAIQLVVGIVLGFAVIPLVLALLRTIVFEVDDEEMLLVTQFGKLVASLSRPGLHVFPARILPWVRTVRVSQRRDFRHFQDVHVNDSRGTTVIVDLWLEFRIADPAKAMFQVFNWDKSLQGLVVHAATAILGNRDFRQILCDRNELGKLLQQDICVETERWGLKVELVFIRNVSLLPDVSRQIFESVAARLERTKADIEEIGRLEVAKIEAQTSAQVAALVGEAKGQYPAAIGKAFERLKKIPQVFTVYNRLYELSLIRPWRTVAFKGFHDGELTAAEAAMITIPPDKRRSSLGGRPHAAADEPRRWGPTPGDAHVTRTSSSKPEGADGNG
jgi:regulator of protease activity HflC (stomatin/prohibitin superfamily)